MNRFAIMLEQFRDILRRHGGGWTGMRSVATRSLRIVRVLGWKGLLHRLRASRHSNPLPANAPDPVQFATASPLGQVRFKTGIMVHAFYADLLDELADDLAHMPVPYVLMVSVKDEHDASAASTRFARLPNVSSLHVRVVPNCGRDIAPFLLDFHDEILKLDLVCHVHTKKSLYAGGVQNQWRRYLLKALLGSRERIGWILGMFHAMPELGMVYPETFVAMPWWAHTWLSNLDCARKLGARLGFGIDPLAYIDYPLGSMFWARTEALHPLFTLKLSREDFPPEEGQTDGTMQHTIERLFGQIVRQQGSILGILPTDGTNTMRSEGERNWAAYFDATPRQRIEFAAIDAGCISFDLFDTLVTRPFLRHSGARAYLAHRVEQAFGLANFTMLREQAETLARANARKDVDSITIYQAMARLPELRGHDAMAIRELELATEARVLKPRRALLDAAHALVRDGKRVIAVSDMYMGASDLRRVLPVQVSDTLQTIHVSCETGWRKDSGEAWRQLPAREGIEPARWLHIGDNEHADVQSPLALGYIGPVHVMRPGSLFDVVPALRPLRPSSKLLERWQDQLWLGLLANHFSELADLGPGAFGQSLLIDTPETFGYTVIGPLLLDYSTWLARRSQEGGNRQLLFLSREGYLLLRAFQRLQLADPALAGLSASYLLTSRRATNTPSLHVIEDLVPIFEASYTGSLDALLHARLGARVAEIARHRLGPAVVAEEVYLPEMTASLIERLRPASEEILGLAREEREAYLAYWRSIRTAATDTIVADIGYAATIQSRLMTITGVPLRGAYFAVRQSAQQAGPDRVDARFHDGRISDDFSPVMQHHLLLEAVLTSPDGQFSHFRSGTEGLVAEYAPNASDPATWATIERVQTGALQFIDDVRAVTGVETSQLAFDPVHVQQPLRCVGTGLWRLGPWAHALRVEDRYTGRGDVAVGVATEHDPN